MYSQYIPIANKYSYFSTNILVFQNLPQTIYRITYVCKIHAVVSYAQFNIYDVPR